MNRRLKIGKKIGLGFVAIIGLMIISTGFTYLKQQESIAIFSEIQDRVSPTIKAANDMESGLHRGLSALRAYIILGADPNLAEKFSTERTQALEELDHAMAKLEIFSQQWESKNDLSSLKIITDNIDAWRSAQKEIEDIAHTDANIPAKKILIGQAAPLAKKVIASLTDLMEIEAQQEASAERRDLFKAMADNRGSFALCLANMRAFLLGGDTNFKTAFEMQWATNEKSFREISALSNLLVDAQQNEWKNYVALRENFEPLPKQMFDLRLATNWNQANTLMKEKVLPLGQRLTTALGQIKESMETRLIETRQKGEAAQAAMVNTLLGLTVIAALIGFVITFLMGRKITKAVAELVERAKIICEGDLTGDPLKEMSRDELGDLANVFNEMQTSLRDQIYQTRSGLENLNSASAQILAATQQQAATMKQQASAVQQINSTMQELSKSGADTCERAKCVAISAEESLETSSTGKDTVNKTVQLMDSIREQVEELAKNIVSLSEKTQAVGKITSAVNDVAERSKLLSLNASIEAASANGEGNRFSVVAEEMKNLADQAKESTAQVRSLLSDIQKGINTTVMLTEESVKRVETGKQHADTTLQTITLLAENTQQSVEAFQQVIAGTNQQQVGFDQVSKGMLEIHQATEDTASSTLQLENAVANLNTLGTQLTGLIKNYKV